MNILKTIQTHASQLPDRAAFRCGSCVMTYKELWERSDRLASWILERGGAGKEPVAVYGHKHPLMLVCFLACVKAGRAYCPIDISVPDARVELILQAVPSDFVFAVEELQADAGDKQVIGRTMLEEILSEAGDGTGVPAKEWWVSGDETYYIIFTSGSTGTPKGVQISADCLNHYLDWSVGLGSSPRQKQGQVFLNQAPFSFDLSVMDLYTSLASGGTLYCLEKAVQSDYRRLLQSLQESEANVWVSTPSFADVCLSERSFCAETMPRLEVFLFCGETLTNRTAHRLQERFPDAKIVNTYGPTESTVAVTEVTVTRELEAQESPLPVGRAKPGTRIEIRDGDGQTLPEGEKGEIIIIGNTVSTGYYGRPDLTEKAFFTAEMSAGQQDCGKDVPARAHCGERCGKAVPEEAHCGENCGKAVPDGVFCGKSRAYRTGDKGYLKNGMLYYCGRIDLQVKLHGYRIELEDIESNICRLAEVEQAVVVPNSRGGKVSSLTAYIVKREISEDMVSERGGIPSEGAHAPDKIKPDREEAARLREALKQYLPEYMIPKKLVFLEHMPMTNNGKADRKALMAGLKGEPA